VSQSLALSFFHEKYGPYAVLAQADLPGVGLDLSGVALRDLRLEVGETGLRLNGTVGGQV